MSKLLIITGGSKGIGFATCQVFLDKGWDVINISRHPCPLNAVTSIACDFMAENWVDNLKTELLPKLEKAEQIALVHNAALYAGGTMQETHAQILQDSLTVNVMAPLQLNQLLMPTLKKGDAIIYIGSTLSEKAVPGSMPYVVSKHALLGLMRSTCQDLDNTGIHTACVCPGFTDTEMLQTHLKQDPVTIAAVTAHVSARRLITPTEIADTIFFAVQNPVMNGAVLHANLGQIER